jgi:hypothetical protein
MSGLVTCGWCLQVVAADGVHSCFDAKKVADHRAAERAVLDAAKAYVDTPRTWPPRARQIVDAVAALRALEEEV